jgi:hypothetical protein
VPANALPREAYEALYGPGWDREPTPAEQHVNLDAAIELYEPIPLLWDGTEHHVRVIPWLEGVKLSRIMLRLVKAQETPPATELELIEFEITIEDAIERMWKLLSPAPEVNPFLDCSPPEVGQLLGFFFMCQTLQSARAPSRVGRRLPSTS